MTKSSLTVFVTLVGGCATKTTTTTGASSACLGDVSHSSLAGYTQDFVRDVADSAYIIRVHVTALHATTVPNTTATASDVIAQVDAVAFHDAEIDSLLGNWGAGATVTIDLATANVAVDDEVYFFTTLEEFNGGQLAVRELGRAQPAHAYDTAIAKMRAMLDANPLYTAIATSVAVVSTDVSALGSVDTGCGSEHCPMWQPASFGAVTALCGDPLDGASFASSEDIAWSSAPKLVVGQAGVFLVHRPEDEAAAFATLGGSPQRTLARAIDVHADADEAEIEALLASPPTF